MIETQKCLRCGKYYKRSYKKCPYCFADSALYTDDINYNSQDNYKSDYSSLWLIFFITIIVVLFVRGGLSTKKNNLNENLNYSKNITTESISKENNEPVIKNYTIGDTVISENVSLQLKNRTISVNKYNKSETLVEIEIELNNNSNNSINFGPTCFNAYCDDYSTIFYNYDLGGLEIMPDKKTMGTITYSLPNNWKKLELFCKTNWNSNKTFLYVIENPAFVK